ncbi:hypothetical protein QC761_512690 [Podospora bellae-mahoneyi]|uniref:Uncharacterized protein n=1 Tax=Podospora bellae-mahoneyi TaxID=2093777 RepID=A0ABR0FDH6_9PEZI|nr:hypothetical protein QC761_512690 [Podospora bellae-mahoneyi]
MGSAISRCNSNSRSNSHGHGTGPGISEMGQKIFERQPNWLTPPSKWRSHHCSHQPVRYRTPTPYPKDDRKRCDYTLLHEKNMIIETPVADHIEVKKPSQKHPAMMHSRHGQQLPPNSTLTITWESHPRLNRFERAS